MEGLKTVVEPTIKSLKAAISTYEMQGGSANIFVNDDGILGGLDQSEVESRKKFYKKNYIGWVARPAHNPVGTKEKPRFLRKGRFKKVSRWSIRIILHNCMLVLTATVRLQT